MRGFKKAVNEGEHEESVPPKQIRSEGAATDAEFPEVAKKAEPGTKSERPV